MMLNRRTGQRERELVGNELFTEVRRRPSQKKKKKNSPLQLIYTIDIGYWAYKISKLIVTLVAI